MSGSGSADSGNLGQLWPPPQWFHDLQRYDYALHVTGANDVSKLAHMPSEEIANSDYAEGVVVYIGFIGVIACAMLIMLCIPMCSVSCNLLCGGRKARRKAKERLAVMVRRQESVDRHRGRRRSPNGHVNGRKRVSFSQEVLDAEAMRDRTCTGRSPRAFCFQCGCFFAIVGALALMVATGAAYSALHDVTDGLDEVATTMGQASDECRKGSQLAQNSEEPTQETIDSLSDLLKYSMLPPNAKNPAQEAKAALIQAKNIEQEVVNGLDTVPDTIDNYKQMLTEFNTRVKQAYPLWAQWVILSWAAFALLAVVPLMPCECCMRTHACLSLVAVLGLGAIAALGFGLSIVGGDYCIDPAHNTKKMLPPDETPTDMLVRASVDFYIDCTPDSPAAGVLATLETYDGYVDEAGHYLNLVNEFVDPDLLPQHIRDDLDSINKNFQLLNQSITTATDMMQCTPINALWAEAVHGTCHDTFKGLNGMWLAMSLGAIALALTVFGHLALWNRHPATMMCRSKSAYIDRLWREAGIRGAILPVSRRRDSKAPLLGGADERGSASSDSDGASLDMSRMRHHQDGNDLH